MEISIGKYQAEPRTVLKAVRKDQGLSQDELAAMSGLSRSTIAQVELGIKVPTTDTIEKLLMAMGYRSFIIGVKL